jgi:cysteine desulfurase
MREKTKIYLDYAATTPIDPGVLRTMKPYLEEKYGNPSSIHQFGQETAQVIEIGREKVAKFLNCKPIEIIFTGSASESDNLAIRGLIKALRQKKKTGERVHIITSSIEHKAVLETCKDLEKPAASSAQAGGPATIAPKAHLGGDIEITYLPVNRDGLINLDDLEAEINPETDLVSIVYANNEMGAVQPIKKIGQLIAKINKNKEHKIYFHTDAVQAANWLGCDVEELGVDLLTLSGHKIYGPKGVGVLYVKKGTPISPLITGGDQEWGLRAGTENVAGIVGMGEAVSKIQISKTKFQKMDKMRERLVRGALKIEGSKLNGPIKKENRLPNIANFSFKGVEGEGLVISLDQEGIAASTGSACTSRELKPSHVLIAMGLSELEAHSSLRISLGKYTIAEEIDYFLKVLPKIIERLRKISGR